MNVLSCYPYSGSVLMVLLMNIAAGPAVVASTVKGEGPDILRTHAEQDLPAHFPSGWDY